VNGERGSDSRRRYIYKSTAMKKYGLTSNQVEEAIRRGLITDFKYVANPHYLSAPQALLISEEELLGKLEEIKKLPRYSEAEREKRRAYRAKRKMLEIASFECPLCSMKTMPLKGSLTRKALYQGQLTPEEARIVAVVTHFRHAHTEYDHARQNLERLASFLRPEEGEMLLQALNRYLRLKRRRGRRAREEREFLLEDFRWLRAKALEKAKRAYTKEAIEKAKRYGLLPQDLTLEQYERIVEKIIEED